jgi:hypothetical protein
MASGGEGAAKVSSAKLTRSIFPVVLWIAAAALVLFGLAALGGALDSAGTDAAGRGLSQAFGVILLFIGGGACLALWLARWWRGWLIVAALIVGAPAAFFGWWATSLAISESRHRQRVEELHSGRYHFGDQPSLLTIAQAISINDVETIRTAAREVRDVQAPGRDGMTLLNFAVTQCWHKPQLVSAVAALLAAGADPNFTSGERDSYAMANSVHGPVALLRTMLDAGGIQTRSTPKAARSCSAFGSWAISKVSVARGSSCCWSAEPIATPRFRAMSRSRPATHCSSTEWRWAAAIRLDTPTPCCCSSAAQIRTAPQRMG